MKSGDLVTWPQGGSDNPGLVLDTRPAMGSTAFNTRYGLDTGDHWSSGINPHGQAVQVMLPDLGFTEWFHECELVKVS